MFTDRENTVFVVIDVHEVNRDVVDDINAGANELQEEYRELHGRNLDAWVDWTDIPREEYIVGFWRGGPRSLSFTQIWKTLPENCDRDGLKGLTFQYAYSVREKEIGMTAKQRNQMPRDRSLYCQQSPGDTWSRLADRWMLYTYGMSVGTSVCRDH